MKKTLHSLSVAVSLLSLTAGAQADPSFYIGGGVLSGSGNFEDTTLVNSKRSNDTSGGAYKLGYITGSGDRLEFSYSAIDLEFPTVTRKVTGFDLDFLWTFGSSQLKPYLGLGLGTYTFEDSARFVVGNKDVTGVAVNLQGGLIFSVVSNIELEAALRAKSIESGDLQRGSRTGSWKQTITNLYLGANITF